MSVAALCTCCGGGESPCTIQIAGGPFVDLTGLTQIGTVSVTSGEAVLESGEGLIPDNGPTNFYDPVLLWVIVSTEDSSGTIRLAVAYLDADNYLFGEYSFLGSTGTLRLGRREDGIETWLTDVVEVEDTEDLGEQMMLMLCWVPGEVIEGGPLVILGATGHTIVDAGVSWINKDNVLLDDGSPAQYAFVEGGNSEALSMIGFPFALPPGTVIDGLEPYVKVRDGSESESEIRLVQLQMIDGTSTAVGDVEGEAGVANFNPNWSTYEYGSPTSILNSGLTWEDLNSPLFGFYVIVQNEAEFERQAEIDHMALDLYATIPDIQPGRLTISRGNVTVASVDCARRFGVTAPGAGKQAMTRAGGGSGTWKVASLTYSYHQSAAKPTCPKCECTVETFPCGCCDPELPAPGALLADFGATGWTAATSECGDVCEMVSGELLYDNTGACMWSITENFIVPDFKWCTLNSDLHLSQGDLEGNPNEDGKCRYILGVAVVYWIDTDLVSPGTGGWSLFGYSYAWYQSEVLDTDECHTFPVTLTKFKETHGGDSCGGTLPETITLDTP